MTSYVSRVDGPAPERDVARDLVKKGLLATPFIVAVCWAIWGTDGALSALYGIAIVCVNFLLAAALITVTARIHLGLMMGAVLFGYLARLALIFAAILLVRDASWVSLVALGLTIIVTHLGLLFWELRYVSINLAFPGLKPDAASK
jgi:ATP synthase I chain